MKIATAAMRILIFLFVVLPSLSLSEEIPSSMVYVVDGDTIDVAGTRIRLIGYDTPETYRAKCDLERDQGEQATLFLDALIHGQSVVDVYLLPRPDRYGRSLGRLFVGGIDVADTLISARLARPYDGRRRMPWC